MPYTQNLFISSDKEVPAYEMNLSICLKADGFSFSVVSNQEELLCIGSVDCNAHSMSEWTSVIKEVFNAYNLPLFGYNSTRLIIETQQFTWIPDHLYDAANDRKYLDMVCKIKTGQAIYSEHNEAIGAHVIFAADNTAVSAFKITIPRIAISCQHSAFASKYLLQRSDLKSLMLINIHNDVADFAVFCNKKLQLSNSYPCSNIEEVCYYGLNVVKQLKLEEASFETLVGGNIDRPHFEFLAKFFPQADIYDGRPLQMANPEMHLVKRYRYPEILS